MADFIFDNHGSIWIMTPQNSGAREYASDVLPGDSLMQGAGYVVEPRYVADIVESLQGDGFNCQPGVINP